MIWRVFLGAGVGALLGYGWYKLVGCSTGACPLTSHPVISTVYGAVLGALVATSLH
ncbi:DUF6132 family protein [Limisphaera sp. VF-2]|jgi:hypothetical protein|uniref:DUF6132 family protein n=1 Tax=Limisphaera sp. VF-2 TaxID=3400418 RepID=UPI001779104B|nr:DUF6132 family protein [Limisphaera sp.]